MQPVEQYSARSYQPSLIATHKVLRNTYLLLGLSLLFSALMTAIAVIWQPSPTASLLCLLGSYPLMFVVSKTRNSAWGLLGIFGFTGLLGFSLGPVLNMYLHTYVNGGQIIMMSLGGTACVFLALSTYVLTTRKNFTYLGGLLFAGMIIAIIGGIANLFLQLPMLDLLISGAIALFSAGYILLQTSLIISGGEQNYIMATLGLFVAIFNLFLSLLRILAYFGGRRD